MTLGEQIAHFRVEEGNAKAVPLPYQVAPMPLDPKVSAKIASLLGLPAGGAPPPVQTAPPAGTGLARALLDGVKPQDFHSVLLLQPSVIRPLAPILWGGQSILPAFPTAATAIQQPAPLLDPKFWLDPRPAAEVKRQELKPLGPGLWLRQVAVSDAAIANASHLATAGQGLLEGLPAAGFKAQCLPGLGVAFDGFAAGVALAEIVKETAHPTRQGFRRFLFYLVRTVSCGKIVIDVMPLSPVVQHSFTVVGLLVKVADEVFPVTLKPSQAS